MTKTWSLIQETVRDTQNAFRQLGTKPAKAKKNRYERRKVRETLRVGDWGAELEV